MAFDVAAALKAGYSENEIALHLGDVAGFDAAGALEAGYSANEIIGKLNPTGAGGGRGRVNPHVAVEDASAGTVAQDAAAGALKIGPTVVKGLADLAQLATGGYVGKDTSQYIQRGMDMIDETVGSDRALQQKQNFQVDMANDNVSFFDALANNKGALADQVLPTVGSMFVPIGAAAGASKLATIGKVAGALDDAALAARVSKASAAAGLGATAAQNAADTYTGLREKGLSQADAYKGAAITVPFTLAAGKLTGGGAEGAIIRQLEAGLTKEAIKRGAMEVPKAFLREGGQEMGEEVGQIAGDALGEGALPSASAAAKRLAVAGTLGGVMGGGVNLAQQASAAAGAPSEVSLEDALIQTIEAKAQQRGAPKVEDMPTTPQAPAASTSLEGILKREGLVQPAQSAAPADEGAGGSQPTQVATPTMDLPQATPKGQAPTVKFGESVAPKAPQQEATTANAVTKGDVLPLAEDPRERLASEIRQIKERTASQPAPEAPAMEVRDNPGVRPLSVEQGIKIMQGAKDRALLPQERGYLDALKGEIGEQAFDLIKRHAEQPYRTTMTERKFDLPKLVEQNKADLTAWDKANTDAANQPAVTPAKQPKGVSYNAWTPVEHKGQGYGTNTGTASTGLDQRAQPTGGSTVSPVGQAPNASVAQAQHGQPGVPGRAFALQSNEPAGTGAPRKQPLKLAKTAPVKVLTALKRAFDAEFGTDVSPRQGPLTEREQVASALAALQGKTLTFLSDKNGNNRPFADGVVNTLGGDHIAINGDHTEDSPVTVAVHEILHSLPQRLRGKFIAAVWEQMLENGTVTDASEEFQKKFQYSDNQVYEELPAVVAQVLAKNKSFWEGLRDKLGEGDFKSVVQHILKSLRAYVFGVRDAYGEAFVKKYLGDVTALEQILQDILVDNHNETVGAKEQTAQNAPEQISVDGVHYAKKVDLVEAPTINMADLIGKKVMPIKADLTAAGREYTGIDGSALYAPVKLMGGPGYPRLKNSAQNNLIWAVREGSTKIINKAKEADVILVVAMNDRSHRTNFTVSSAYLDTVDAYLRDRKINKANLKQLDALVRADDKKHALEDFPGFLSKDIHKYLDALSFDKRGALATILETKEAQNLGLPNFDRFAREMLDPEHAGSRAGDVLLAMELDKENPTVQLGEDGTDLHPSYPQGLRGKLLGKLPAGVNYEQVFKGYFEKTVPTFKNGKASAWYSFDRVTPVQEITPEIAQQFPVGGYEAIASPRQASALLSLANGDWLQSGKTKAAGGVSIQEFVDALKANDGAPALTLYSPEDVKSMVKEGKMTVYQLGKEGGDKGMQVFFGLKRGAPWYKGMIDAEVSDNEVELVSVTNNELGAPGVALPAILTKAIEDGATVLDAYAVKSKRFPDGFLPEMYAQFGFEEIGKVDFDPQYLVDKPEGMSDTQHKLLTKNKLADLKAFWQNGGWQESDGYPAVVVMRWKGSDNDRAGTVDRYVRSGETGVPEGSARYYGSPTEETVGQRDSSSDEQGRAGSSNAGPSGRDQGASNAAPVVARAHRGIQSVAKLSDQDAVNLGLDPKDVGKLRDKLATPFARKAEPDLDQDIVLEIPVEGGGTAKLTVNAKTYLEQLDRRQEALEMVKECML